MVLKRYERLGKQRIWWSAKEVNWPWSVWGSTKLLFYVCGAAGSRDGRVGGGTRLVTPGSVSVWHLLAKFPRRVVGERIWGSMLSSARPPPPTPGDLAFLQPLRPSCKGQLSQVFALHLTPFQQTVAKAESAVTRSDSVSSVHQQIPQRLSPIRRGLGFWASVRR